MITDPAAIRIRALIPDHHAALRIGRAMSMPRLERRSLPATGLPSASGTGRAGGSAACESAASIKLGLPALLFDIFPRLIVGLADNYRSLTDDLSLTTCDLREDVASNSATRVQSSSRENDASKGDP
jgi:hypothetical protein